MPLLPQPVSLCLTVHLTRSSLSEVGVPTFGTSYGGVCDDRASISLCCVSLCVSAGLWVNSLLTSHRCHSGKLSDFGMDEDTIANVLFELDTGETYSHPARQASIPPFHVTPLNTVSPLLVSCNSTSAPLALYPIASLQSPPYPDPHTCSASGTSRVLSVNTFGYSLQLLLYRYRLSPSVQIKST